MNAQKPRGFGCVSSLLIVVLATIGFAVFADYASKSRGIDSTRTPTPPAAPAGPSAEEKAEAKRQLNEYFAKAPGVTRVDSANHLVRVDPLIWVGLPLDSKQAMVTNFSRWFGVMNGNPAVEIRSSDNDLVLAEYTAWNGVKVHL